MMATDANVKRPRKPTNWVIWSSLMILAGDIGGTKTLPGVFEPGAGNLGLRSVATGAYVGGGIAPNILPPLGDGGFLRAFGSKSPLGPLLAKMPVRVILNPEAGLIGAPVYATGDGSEPR
jgi:glucokinase